MNKLGIVGRRRRLLKSALGCFIANTPRLATGFLDRQSLAPLASSSGDNSLPTARAHSFAETMRALTLDFCRCLQALFHNRSIIS